MDTKGDGGLYKILLPKQGIVPYGTFLHEFFQMFHAGGLSSYSFTYCSHFPSVHVFVNKLCL